MNAIQKAIARVFGIAQTVAGMPDRPATQIDQPFALIPEAIDFPKAYRKIGIIRACVDRVAQDVAMLPVLFEREVGKEWKPLERSTGNIVDVWHGANPAQAGIEMVRDLAAYYEISGNSYLVMETFGTSRVRELWTLPSHLVEPVPGRDRTERGYRFDRGGMPVFVPAEYVIHLRAFNPDDEPVGTSALESVRHAYENRYDAGRLMQNMLRSGGTANGFFRMAGSDKRDVEPLKGPERAAAERALARMYSGVDATRRPRILDVWEFVQTGMTVDQLKMLESNKDSDADICRALGVPPWLVGIKEGGKLSDGSGGSNTDERLYWQNKVRPLVEFRDRTLTEKLCPRFEQNLRVRTDFSRVLALQQPLYNAAQQLVALTGRPVLSVNELRVSLGMPRIESPDADELYEKPALSFGGPSGPAMDSPDAGNGNASDGKPAAASLAGGKRMIDGDAVREERRRAASVSLRRYEKKLEREFAALLKTWRGRAVTALESVAVRGRSVRSLDPDDVFDVTEDDRADLLRILEALVLERGEEALAELALAYEIDLHNLRASKFIEAQASRVLTQVSDTTKKALREMIADQVESGASMADIITRVVEMPEFGIARAQMIARTETVSAYNYSTAEAWRQSGVVEQVEWLSARDSAVRPEHADADGQRADIGQAFDVGGSALEFPGDPNGPADMTINCRCTLLPVVAEEPERGLSHLFAPPAVRPANRLAHLMNGHTNGVAK